MSALATKSKAALWETAALLSAVLHANLLNRAGSWTLRKVVSGESEFGNNSTVDSFATIDNSVVF